jgi:dTDP-4-amino-4,6-dideoxygalactose transaminase
VLVETERLAAAALTLPMANDLGPSDVERIAECIRGATAVAARG